MVHFIPLSWFILMDHTRPIELFVSQILKKRGLIFFFKFCLNNLFVLNFKERLWFEYWVSFITYKFQIFYKFMYLIWDCQVFFKLFLQKHFQFRSSLLSHLQRLHLKYKVFFLYRQNNKKSLKCWLNLHSYFQFFKLYNGSFPNCFTNLILLFWFVKHYNKNFLIFL